MPEVSEQDLRLVLTALQFGVEEGYTEDIQMERLKQIGEDVFGHPHPSRRGDDGTVAISERRLSRIVGLISTVDWSLGALPYEYYPEARRAGIRLAEAHGIDGAMPEMVTVPAEELELVLERYWALSQQHAGREPFAYDASSFLNEVAKEQTE